MLSGIVNQKTVCHGRKKSAFKDSEGNYPHSSEAFAHAVSRPRCL